MLRNEWKQTLLGLVLLLLGAGMIMRGPINLMGTAWGGGHGNPLCNGHPNPYGCCCPDDGVSEPDCNP